MMDNTLIVLYNNAGSTQRCQLAVVLLGNYGGAFKTGCFTQQTGSAPSTPSTSILRASGVNIDRYNMSEQMAAKFDSSTGRSRKSWPSWPTPKRSVKGMICNGSLLVWSSYGSIPDPFENQVKSTAMNLLHSLRYLSPSYICNDYCQGPLRPRRTHQRDIQGLG